ncbi:MAG TPA: hypothetical protein DCR35_12960 [Runella sp.]|nr:hypothetical protein [Runella sp.]HAO50124.1 hypothetical protein [Runella sp.]
MARKFVQISRASCTCKEYQYGNGSSGTLE